MVKKYNVYTFNFETKDGKNALDKWLNSSNQDMDLEASYDNLAEAKAAYDKLPARCVERGRYGKGTYYLHFCKALDAITYDDNGEEICSLYESMYIDCGEVE